MRRISLFALLVIVLAAAPVRADFLGWQYDWVTSPSTIPTAAGGNLSVIGFSGTNTTLLESVAAAGITASSTDAQTGAIASTPYTLTVTLTDTASGDSSPVMFNGTFSGSYANLSNSYTGSTTKQVLLGTNNYTVSLGAYYAPTELSPGDFFPGLITATISVTPEPQTAPEPASLALVACALPGLGLTLWRRRQK